MKLFDIVSVSEAVSRTRARKGKRALLAELLREMSPPEVRIGVAYLAGLLPQGRVGLGPAAFRDLLVGPAVAEASLELREVDARFSAMAAIEGAGAKRRRQEALGALFARATEVERAFLQRLVLGELRQGALLGVMGEAVSAATGVNADAIRRAAMLAGGIVEVAAATLIEGSAGLEDFRLTLFRPVLPMLATPSEDLESAIERLEEPLFERKLDGARIQVHKQGDEVRIYSRLLHDVTERLPEVQEAARGLRATELILDGEVIALRDDGRPHPFQTTMRRFGRKRGIAEMRRTLPVSQFYFDLLLLDGDALLDRPAGARLEALDAAVPATLRVPRLITADVERARSFWSETLDAGHEGLMAKSLEAPYAAGSRGAAWLKLKPSHTLDLVVVAVEEGSGRRKGWLSNLHLAAHDPSRGEFVMLGKTFKGMTDAMLKWQTKRLSALALGREGHVVHVRPELVVEVAFSDVQVSSAYPGGMALRFARVKGYREDKPVSEAATIDEVRTLLERGHRRP